MKIGYDSAKNVRNMAERQLPFDRAADFGWDDAVIIEDVRKGYPERRFVAIGCPYRRLHVLCFTPTADGIWVISFRKANVREVRKHGKALTLD